MNTAILPMIKSGVIKDGALATPVSDVNILAKSSGGKIVAKIISGKEGKWQLELTENVESITFQKKGYTSKTYSLTELPELIRLLENDLVGYQPKLWFKPGENVNAYLHSVSNWKATVYRHGLSKTKILDIEGSSKCIQHLPDSYFVEEGLNWQLTTSYKIPDDARPGLYSLLIENEKEKFAIPFIVSSPKPANKILVLASTNNWQSYNVWGGRNRYRNYESEVSKDFSLKIPLINELAGLAGKSLPTKLKNKLRAMLGLPPNERPWMFQKLSVNRPFTNCALEGVDPMEPFTNHLAGGEWRVLAWLEKEGIPYDIISGFELHQNPDILQSYKAILLSTHSEYWSKSMFCGLKEAHLNHELSVLNISGNSIYREVDFFEDGSHRCLSLHFDESVEDETKIIGVRFTESDYGSCAPFRIKEPGHWVFSGVQNREKGQVFGEHSLNRFTPPKTERYNPGRPGSSKGLTKEGASGWETDKLSKAAPNDIVRVAKGMNNWGGADMIVREPKGKRGGLFSASSITFGGALLIDEVCSQIVRNVINRFYN